jgi:hypothetical protein
MPTNATRFKLLMSATACAQMLFGDMGAAIRPAYIRKFMEIARRGTLCSIPGDDAADHARSAYR